MKKRVLLVIGLFLMVFMVGGVSAITGVIGKSRITIENVSVGETIEKYIIVKNVNDIPIDIDLTASGDLGESIDIRDEHFILESGESEKSYFIISVTEEGTTESYITVNFTSGDSDGVTLVSNITLIAVDDVQTDYEERISSLESWQETINDWREDITNTISDIWNAITGNTDRIEILENQNYTCEGCGNETFPEYLNFLSSSDRKKIVCGYGESHRLDSLEALGYDCTFEYKVYSSGRERIRCKCKTVK